MNGVHDMGGMQGFGPVVSEEQEPVFHADWEKRVLAMFPALAATGNVNLDAFRHAIERMGQVEYLSTSYYEHWLAAFEWTVVHNGIVTAEELEARQAKIAAELG